MDTVKDACYVALAVLAIGAFFYVANTESVALIDSVLEVTLNSIGK